MPRVLIYNHQKKKRLNLPEISGLTSRIMALLGEKKSEISLVFVTNSEITALNKKYLASRRSTDVLAFPMRDGDNYHPELLGDVVISVEKAVSQAREWRQPFEKELIRLIVHGILHLLGYKDKKKSERRRMIQRQEQILSMVTG